MDVTNLTMEEYKGLSHNLYNELLCGQQAWSPKQKLAIPVDFLKSTLHTAMLSSECFDYVVVYTCRLFGAEIIYDGAKKTTHSSQSTKIDPNIMKKAATWKIHRLDYMASVRQIGGVTERMRKRLINESAISPRHNHFIPDCYELHYNSAILAKGALNFEMMDSLGHGFDTATKKFVKDTFQTDADQKKDLQFSEGKVPKQTNLVDCGYCTMYFCWHKLFGLSIPSQQTMMNDIVKIRTWSLLRIYKDGTERGDYPPDLIGRAFAQIHSTV